MAAVEKTKRVTAFNCSPPRSAEQDEAIRAAGFPGAMPPAPGEPRLRPIEREDFPAPAASALILAEKCISPWRFTYSVVHYIIILPACIYDRRLPVDL